ncbi:ABC transporter transmembrane domain-containing protein, partial [Stomatobaculum longum]|uniref:ABC transporter transmembrane domain-containing protein n=1 Tax=Stomatobaculum longum TaxID=796942 RepID=UPI0028063A9F
MIKMFSKYLGKKYHLISLLAVFGMVMEVVVENLVPLVMANLIDNGIQAQNFNVVLRAGGLMVALALFGLLFGSIGGYFAAAAGLAASLRSGIYRSIQRFSFGNLDKYSTAGLVTRLTTDVSNVQNSYQMILRTCMRAPATLIFTLALTFSISRKLSMIFLVALGFLLIVLILVIKFADKAFTRVFS